jgi:hypothetical protein
MKEAATAAASMLQTGVWGLFKLGRDAREFFVERAAQPIDHCDDRNRNACCDQAVFDGGSAGFVLQKRNNLGH